MKGMRKGTFREIFEGKFLRKIHAFPLLAFLALLVVYLSASASENTLVLPKPTGLYRVGTVNMELRDSTRSQLRRGKKRRWMVTVFYPALLPDPGSAPSYLSASASALTTSPPLVTRPDPAPKPTLAPASTTSSPLVTRLATAPAPASPSTTAPLAPYMPGTLEEGEVCGVRVLGHAIPKAQGIPGHTFPLILFFPGRGAERQKYTILCSALASHGYVVMAMDQPYGANFVKFPDGTNITLTLKDLWKLPRDRDYRYAYDDEIIASAIQDVDFVLDHLLSWGGLLKAINRDKIILMGHSLGGNIAHIKGFSDKRVAAVVDIDSKITEREVFGNIRVPPNSQFKPVLFLRGMLQYQEDVGDSLGKIPKSTLWCPRVQHSAFSDEAYFAAKIPFYGMGLWWSFYNYIFKQGPYFSATDTGLGPYGVEEWFERYPQVVVHWLDKKMRRGP